MFTPSKISLAAALLIAAAAPAHAAPRTTPEARIVELTNEARAAAGCGPLVPTPELTRAASAHARNMADHDFFAHSAPFGGRSGGLPSGGIGENIAAGKPTPERTFAQWINSDGHRANIEDCEFTKIGVGHAFNAGSRYGHYWVQEFSG